MSRPRAMRPILGASSRLLLEQFVSPTTRTARGKLVAPRPGSPASRPSICLSCSFTRSRQLRFSSTNTEPPKPPPNGENKDRASTTSSETEQPPQPSLNAGSEPTPSNRNLPSHSESQRSHVSQNFSSFMDRAQTTLFVASQRINDLTGYSGIETLKDQIASLETSLTNAQTRLHAARTSYKSKVAERSATQREVTTLLARQKTWTPLDFERFTTLYRQDYELEADVAESARELEDAEREAERLGRELSTGILARYHEEQIWSDKIRRMSTWGTWGLMSVNVLLFLVFQFGAEPWRRARLVRGFEEKVKEALEEERERNRILREEDKAETAAAVVAATTASAFAAPALVDTVGSDQAGAEAAVAEPRVIDETTLLSENQTPIRWREMLTDPEQLKAAAADLTSDRKVAIRMRDLSFIALEGVIGGAAIAGAIALFFVRRA